MRPNVPHVNSSVVRDKPPCFLTSAHLEMISAEAFPRKKNRKLCDSFAVIGVSLGGGMLLQFSLDSEFEAGTKPKHDVLTEYKHCLA